MLPKLIEKHTKHTTHSPGCVLLHICNASDQSLYSLPGTLQNQEASSWLTTSAVQELCFHASRSPSAPSVCFMCLETLPSSISSCLARP